MGRKDYAQNGSCGSGGAGRSPIVSAHANKKPRWACFAAGGNGMNSYLSRRSVFWLGAGAAAAVLRPRVAAAAKKTDRLLSWSDFTSRRSDLLELAQDRSAAGVDAYLYSIASLAVRLADVPAAKLSPYKPRAPLVSFAPIHRGVPFFVIEWQIEPGGDTSAAQPSGSLGLHAWSRGRSANSPLRADTGCSSSDLARTVSCPPHARTGPGCSLRQYPRSRPRQSPHFHCWTAGRTRDRHHHASCCGVCWLFLR